MPNQSSFAKTTAVPVVLVVDASAVSLVMSGVSCMDATTQSYTIARLC
jgi:cobyrinic acid a,c-diamide synthase